METGKDIDFRKEPRRQPRPRSYVAPERFANRSSQVQNRPPAPQSVPKQSAVSEILPTQKPKPTAVAKKPQVKRSPPKPAAKVNLPKQQPSVVLHRKSTRQRIREVAEATFILRSRKSVILTSAAVLVCAAALFGVFGVFRTNGMVQTSKQSATVTSPSEAILSDAYIQNYSVPPTDPQSIVISKIGVDTVIQKRPSNLDQQPLVPTNTHIVGWDENSAHPDEPGAVLLNGIANGATQLGVFAKLGTLQQGDVIVLKRGDGQVFSYRVESLQSYLPDQVDMKVARKSLVPGKKGLNLLTSSERYNIKTNSFEKRLLVFAIQL